jgi:hypothetical protein
MLLAPLQRNWPREGTWYSLGGERNHSARAPSSRRVHTRTHLPSVCTIPPIKTVLAHPWGLDSLRGCTARRQREARWAQLV